MVWPRSWLRHDPRVARLCLGMAGYSLLLLAVTWALGVATGRELPDLGKGVRFQGYWEKPNWSLFILFWFLIGGVVHLTWRPFVAAWRHIARNGVLLDARGGRVGTPALEALLRRLGVWRRVFAAGALLVAAALVAWDARDVIKLYGAYCDPSCLRVMHERHAAPAPGTLVRVLEAFFGRPQAPVPDGCAIGEEVPELEGALELDFTLACFVPPVGQASGEGGLLSRQQNIALNVAVFLQELVLGALALLALGQVVIHALVFWFLERLRCTNPDRLQVRLAPLSPVHEYGLEAWNHALNNVYWVLSFALLVPIVSRASQSGEAHDAGQWILQWLVPVLIAAPMVLTILGRQQRLPRVRAAGARLEGRDDVERFHAQRLWPLDRNWVSKLGIVLAFSLLACLLGINLLLAVGGAG